MKEATGDFKRLEQILMQTNGAIDVYSGDDLSACEWMLAGAKGVISVTANVAPKHMAKLCDMTIDKDEANCLKFNDKLMPLHSILFTESNPIPVKWALHRLGLINDEIRAPLTRYSTQYHSQMDNILTELDILA